MKYPKTQAAVDARIKEIRAELALVYPPAGVEAVMLLAQLMAKGETVAQAMGAMAARTADSKKALQYGSQIVKVLDRMFDDILFFISEQFELSEAAADKLFSQAETVNEELTTLFNTMKETEKADSEKAGKVKDDCQGSTEIPDNLPDHVKEALVDLKNKLGPDSDIRFIKV